MLLKVFSVYDSKSETYGRPFCAKTKGEAIRDFTDVANNKDNNIGKYPTDFALFHLGDFDDNSGVVTPLSVPVSLGLAQEFVHGS